MAPSLFVNVAIFVILNFIYFLIQQTFFFKLRFDRVKSQKKNRIREFM